jgi:hypothetical protein
LNLFLNFLLTSIRNNDIIKELEQMSVKVIVAGGRDFDDYNLLNKTLVNWFRNLSPKDVVIISGGANGADKLGEQFAEDQGCRLVVFNADWDLYGDSAGYIRNAEMAKHADACICFWDGESKGTRHMINIAKKEGLALKVVTY